ncbi:MAG: Crp/Fnr family transcriptional regulator [Hyphomicrobiaceae bacterium]
MRVIRGHSSLGRIPLFQGVEPAEIEILEQRCVLRHYDAGEEILGYLDGGDDVYFIVSGKAKVIIYSSLGKVVGFRDLVPGDMFGEYAAIDGGTRSASIEAEADSLVAVVPSGEFRGIVAREPSVAMALLQHLTKQLRALTKRVFEFSTLAVNNRIQAELLRLAKEVVPASDVGSNSARISPSPTHVEIAARISTHREAVTRQFSQLSKDGIIAREGRELIVLDVARLEKMVGDASGE